MKYGIVTVSIAAIRAEASQVAEMTSQLLFGERFTVINETGNWLYISCFHDAFEGWLFSNQASPLTKDEFTALNKEPQTFSFDLVSSAISNQEHIPIILGSSLPSFDGLSFRIQNKKVIYNGQVLTPDFEHPDNSLVQKISYKFLNAPFLWGGRSAFGIDAAGFVQVVFQCCGFRLPRTIQQQIQLGKTIHLLGEAKLGDIVYFKTDEDDHIGICLGNETVIHCSEKVKLSTIDSHGIIDSKTKQYSHKLAGMKRLL